MALAASSRYLAAGSLLGASSDAMRVTRPERRRADRAYAVTLWAEKAIRRHRASLVVLVTGSPYDEACRDAARRCHRACFDLSVDHIARILGARSGTRAALSAVLSARLREDAPKWLLSTPQRSGVRTDWWRSREMPLVALAGALAFDDLLHRAPARRLDARA